MSTATNEACIGQLDENHYLMGEKMTLLVVEEVNLLGRYFSGWGKEQVFGCWVGFSHISRVSYECLGE